MMSYIWYFVAATVYAFSSWGGGDSSPDCYESIGGGVYVPCQPDGWYPES